MRCNVSIAKTIILFLPPVCVRQTPEVCVKIFSSHQMSTVDCCLSFSSRPAPASRGSDRSPEVSTGDDQDDSARLEAERKLEELKRRRDDAESEEFERMRQRQQEAEAELEELKRKREERRKVLEEEERMKKQEEAERKAREEVEKGGTPLMLFDQLCRVSQFPALVHPLNDLLSWLNFNSPLVL